MIDLTPRIKQVEALLAQDTDASLTYAALECRLAIERICYERLRVLHDYISQEDLRGWQPRDIVNTLIEQVEPKTTRTIVLKIGNHSLPAGPHEPSATDEEQEWITLGTQIGFNPQKLGKLWNALSNLALHIAVPVDKHHAVARYGDAKKIRTKVEQALEEIRRHADGTMIATLPAKDISFACSCGVINKRKLEFLGDGQIVNCISPKCRNSYWYRASDNSFGLRFAGLGCAKCGTRARIPARDIDNLTINRSGFFLCEGCGDKISIIARWEHVQDMPQPQEPPEDPERLAHHRDD